MANRYFLNIGANWGDTANWSDTSGGTGGFSVPTNADDVFFDANSGNCTVNVASVAKSVNFTGYTNTITMTNTLTVSGNVTLAAAMGVAGTAELRVDTTSTFTSNGKTWSADLSFRGAITITLADDLNVSGVFSTGTSGTVTVNGTFSINCSGGINFTESMNQGIGVTTLNLTGGTCTASGTNAIRFNTVNINGNITIGTVFFIDSPNFNYLGGSVTTAGSILQTQTATLLNWNLSGINWNSIYFNASITLLSNLTCVNLVKSGVSNNTLNGAFTINVSGNLTLSNGGIISGAASILLNGTGTWSSSGTALRNNLTINTAGTITISGNVYYNTGTLTYTSGTVNANTATLNVALATTFINCDKINFKTITITAATTQTFNRFFSGSALVPTRIQSGTAGTNYTITFQDSFEKITKFTKISNCTVTNRGQLLCITDKSNKGGNVGVRYINQMPNGLPKNSPSTTNPIGYARPNYLLSDPNTILI